MKERFSKFNSFKWATVAFLGVITLFGLYMSIAFSVQLARGLTLFGESGVTSGVETSGPTSFDISVLILYWVLTLICVGILVYELFFKKIEEPKKERKEIIDGKAVIVKEEDESK